MIQRVPPVKSMVITLLFFVLLPIAAGCGNTDRDEVLTVGIISHMPASNPAMEGFVTGLKDFGYTEDGNLVLIYREVSDAIENSIVNAFSELKDKHMDLLLTFEHDITLACKSLSKDMELPVIFISNPDPVYSGLVDSLALTGGNLTGIRMPETVYKTVEWISEILPLAKTVYLPYNPTEGTASADIERLRRTASEMGLSLLVDEIQSAEESAAAIEGLRGDIDAVLMLPSHALNHESSLITRTATELGIPTFASLLLDESVLLTFTGDFTFAGRQAARQAVQVFTGSRPSDLPVETSDAFLIINLKTAEETGVTISQGVLSLAQTIIR